MSHCEYFHFASFPMKYNRNGGVSDLREYVCSQKVDHTIGDGAAALRASPWMEFRSPPPATILVRAVSFGAQRTQALATPERIVQIASRVTQASLSDLAGVRLPRLPLSKAPTCHGSLPPVVTASLSVL
jgi:hypothetical protein